MRGAPFEPGVDAPQPPVYALCVSTQRPAPPALDLRLDVTRAAHGRVVAGPGALAHLADAWPAGAAAFVVADARVGRLHGAAVRAALAPVARALHVLPFRPGEASKTRRTAFRLLDRLLALGAERSDVVVGFGGGVALDLAGVVASLALRGLPLVQVPTSLLAMIDAGIGGKAALDTPLGKNLVGAFHWPRLVAIDPGWLATLPPAELRNGLAEAAKHAALVGGDLLGRLERFAGSWDGRCPPPAALVAELAAVKVAVVQRDPFEAGERRTLNLGHTVGHALEAAAGFALPHGEAVAVGLIVEARVAQRLCGLPFADVARLQALLSRLGLPTAPAVPFEQAWPFLCRDKKAHGGRVRLSLLRRLGQPEPADGSFATEVDAPTLEACWHDR